MRSVRKVTRNPFRSAVSEFYRREEVKVAATVLFMVLVLFGGLKCTLGETVIVDIKGLRSAS